MGFVMPRRAKELSAVEVRRLACGVHNVGGVAGLLMQVSGSGAQSWLLRVRVGDKRREIGLGPFPEVSLARAREKAAAAKEAIRNGIRSLWRRARPLDRRCWRHSGRA